MMGFDFADPERGISGSLRPSGAAVLFDHDAVIAAGAAEPRVSDDGGEASVELEIDGAALSLQLSRLGTPVSLRGERSGEEELAVCRVLGELHRDGETVSLGCLGVRSDATSEEEPAGVSVTRSIAVAFADGSILALRAARPEEAEEHGSEEIVAVTADAEGVLTEIREPLLSTHYDDSGRQLRATLELWPAEEEPLPPIRAAGSVVCGTSMSDGERRVDLAIFRWSMDGTPGLGRYEIVSPA
jgi:hypothetical protein